MIMIVAVDRKWGIGKNGDLLVKLPSDLRHFRETTEGGVVIMGRRTFESLPGRKPLKNRINIILTRNPGYFVPGAQTICSIDSLLDFLKGYDNKHIFVIGGGEIYRLLYEHCAEAIVSKIDAEFDADTYFPDLDSDPGWFQVSQSVAVIDGEYSYSIVRYIRR